MNLSKSFPYSSLRRRCSSSGQARKLYGFILAHGTWPPLSKARFNSIGCLGATIQANLLHNLDCLTEMIATVIECDILYFYSVSLLFFPLSPFNFYDLFSCCCGLLTLCHLLEASLEFIAYVSDLSLFSCKYYHNICC